MSEEQAQRSSSCGGSADRPGADKIRDEYREVMVTIADLLDILAKPARHHRDHRDELKHIKEKFGDRRRSEIVTVAEDISLEDLIAPQDWW